MTITLTASFKEHMDLHVEVMLKQGRIDWFCAGLRVGARQEPRRRNKSQIINGSRRAVCLFCILPLFYN